MLDQLVSLRLEVASALPAVLGDRVQLQQVIINLVMNGMEAMAAVTGRPRELVIRAHRHEGEQVLIEVCDSGVGIELQVATTIFSTPSSPPSPMAWGWGCRSPARSSKPTADGYGPPATPAPARRFTSRCHRTGRLRRDGVRRGRERRADRVRHRRRRVGTQRTLESLPLGRLARAGLRLGAGVPAEQARRCSELPGPRHQAAGTERTRFSNRTGQGEHPYPDHLHDRPRRHSDDRTGHEGRRGRFPEQAVSRPGHAGCRGDGDRA